MAISFTDPRTLIATTSTHNIITTTNTSGSGYSPHTDTIYGIPVCVWQDMSPSEQRHYMEREYLRQRQQAEQMFSTPPTKAVEPDYRTNKKLLLLGEAT